MHLLNEFPAILILYVLFDSLVLFDLFFIYKFRLLGRIVTISLSYQ